MSLTRGLAAVVVSLVFGMGSAQVVLVTEAWVSTIDSVVNH